MSPFISRIQSTKIIRALRQIARAFGSYKLHVAVIVFLGFVSSILEGLGITAVIPIFSFVGGRDPSSANLITQFIERFFGLFNLTYSFRSLIIFIGVLFALRVIMLFVIQYITSRIVYGYERDMRNRLFALTVNAGWPYLSKQKTGHLDQFLITNTTNVSQFFSFFSTLVLISTKTIAYIFVAINISVPIALGTTLAGGLAFFGFRPLFYKNKIISTQAEKYNRTLAHFTSQHVAGMKTIKALAVEAPLIEKAGAYFEYIRSLFVSMSVLRSFTEMLVKFAGMAFIGIVFVFMYRSPGFNVASFAVIVYAINQIFVQVQAAQTQFHAVSTMLPYLTNVLLYSEDAKKGAENQCGKEKFILERSVEFSGVSFAYPERGKALSDISFSINKGGVIGIIGPSGSGKTTVVDLLLRLYEPEKGDILIDGRSVRQVSLSEWRKRIGYVAQDIFLLNDTIRNNIIFYDSSLAFERVKQAAQDANIHEFIETLPNGYDTIIGDRGVFLSGGQRQRIILARILARKPELLILDEATSSLDAESEVAIQQAIDKLHGKITILIIAHRLSTISFADKLIVLEDGKIVETGSPKELLENKDSYFYKVRMLEEK